MEEGGSPPQGTIDSDHTPLSTSDGMEVKEERTGDLMDTRTTSTATLHRLDMSPAPSSTRTARRSDGSSRSEELRFRVLCPVSSVGAIIGRKGDNVKRLRQEANADILIEDYVAGSDERVMSIVLHRDAPHHSSTAAGDAMVAVFDNLCELRRDVAVASTSSEDQEESVAVGSADAEEDSSMHGNPAELNQEGDEYAMRMLVDSTQVGFLVGKHGATIKKIVDETGARVRFLPKAELPVCAWVNDEILLISGSHTQVSSALRLIARKLEQHPPRPQIGSRLRSPMLLAHASTGDLMFMPPPSASVYGGMASSSTNMLPGTCVVETVFRLLAPIVRTGNIIGRNGDHVRRIRAETGARIKVYDVEGDVEERLVCVFSTEDSMSQYCSAQDALVRCAISLTADDASTGQHRVRLLAPQTSIGAVLGKKGITVMQLRKETGASIRVHPVEAPLAAAAATAHGGGEPGGDEIVQIDGTLQQCIAAMRGVATVLRGWQIRRATSLMPRITTVAMSPATLMAQAYTFSPMHSGMLAVPMGHHGTSSGTASPSSYGAGGPVLWRYRLSNAQAGAVIGKGGHHVSQIRALTGARVHLPTEQSPDSLRTLEISGPVESCQAAHSMVNQFLSVAQCNAAVPEHQSGSVVFATPSTISSPLAVSCPSSPHVGTTVASGDLVYG